MQNPIDKREWIVAHRGAMVTAPENTLAAFDAALSNPIDGIEFDVQMTKDGVLVLFHDPNLAKINGASKAISDYKYEELRAFDWGSWHSDAYRGEALVTLEQAVDHLIDKTHLLVEIKSLEEDRASGRSLDITKQVLQVLRSQVPEARKDNVFILSFDPEVLRQAQGAPWHLVINVEDPPKPPDIRDLAGDLYAWSAPINRLEPAMTKRWHESGKVVMTYSCNTPAEVDRARELECDVIMTDQPDWAVQYLNANPK